jgi:hypothetical protein
MSNPLPSTGGDHVAATLLAAASSVRERIESARLESFSQWWEIPLAVCVAAGILAAVAWLYRRDAAELPLGTGVALAALRLTAFGCLAAAWLDIERTRERELIFPSRVAVVVDTSASMAIADPADDPVAGSSGDSADRPPGPAVASGHPTRASRGLQLLRGSGESEKEGLLGRLREVHEVSVWRFDAESEPLVVLPRGSDTPQESPPRGTAAGGAADDRPTIAADPPDAAADPPGAGARADTWTDRLVAQGFETRLGEVLERVLEREPRGTLAGVVLVTDGASNAGVDAVAAAGLLGREGIPLVPVGLGSDRLPPNVRVADVVSPQRIFPGDRFSVTGYLQGQGLAGRRVRVELVESPRAESLETGGAGGRVLDAAESVVGPDGDLVAVRFDLPGIEAPGRKTLSIRLVPPPEDTRPADDRQAVEIEVVDRVTQVLLMAGGPSREYQFTRNLLERDDSFAVDVLLATARSGTSQDARRVLEGFPETPEALAEYDAIVAYDYDWRLLDPQQMARLERWVSRESGGLVLVHGPIFTPAWVVEPACGPLRAMAPLEMRLRLAAPMQSDVIRDEPMPLAFTPDGLEAEFLWIADTSIASRTLWGTFPGVYSCYEGSTVKPGATAYARAGRGGVGAGAEDGPIFIAGHFYGSGTALSIGSGELWRLRSVDDTAFERLTTQLVRHVAQGRLLRGSRSIRVLVDRDRYAVGAGVAVRVLLPEGSTETPPGRAPEVVVGTPDGGTLRVPVRPDPARPGEFSGTFVAGSEGTWRIEATLGEGAEATSAGERAVRTITAKLPDRELQRATLDAAILGQMAGRTGTTPVVLGTRSPEPSDVAAIAAVFPDRSRTEYQSGGTDTAFKRRLNAWLLGAAAAALCCEWIVRRLARLA